MCMCVCAYVCVSACVCVCRCVCVSVRAAKMLVAISYKLVNAHKDTFFPLP